MNDMKTSLFNVLSKAGALEEFRGLMEEWVRATAVEITGAADDNYLHALRGQMRICIELADGAASALESGKASANADSGEGTRNTLG